MTIPLSTIAQLSIEPSLARHPFVIEAFAIASAYTHRSDGRALQTINEGYAECQLFGWGCNVPEHVDESGWVYFLPIVGEPSLICVGAERVLARNGDVVRMDDSVSHLTLDETARVCLFAGPYHRPADHVAIAVLTEGLRRLAAGADNAPRVSEADRAWFSMRYPTLLESL